MAWGIYNGPQRKGECPATLSPYYRTRQPWAWVAPDTLRRDTTNFVVPYDYSNPKFYVIAPPRATEDEHYLFETRLRTGFDQYIPRPPNTFGSQPGTLLVWHHNMRDYTPGSLRGFDAINIKAADNSFDSLTVLTDFFPANAQTNRQSLNDLTVPAATLGWRDSIIALWFGNERPANFALNGIQRLADGSTRIDTIALRYAMTSTAVIDGWHALSVPVNVPNFSKTAVYPTATTPAFAYVPDSGYVQRSTLQLGQGYFLRFGATQNIPLCLY